MEKSYALMRSQLLSSTVISEQTSKGSDKRYHLYTDSGHAWLRVPKAELASLGIAEKISQYSYIRDQYAYLEEDCDCFIFETAKQIQNPDWQLDENHIILHSSNNSSIRDYESYNKDNRYA